MSKKIGVILADTNEYEPFVNFFADENKIKTNVGGNEAVEISLENSKTKIIAVHCGIGKVNAANAAAALIYSCKVDAILNAGLSGAISSVRREDIVAGSEYIECDFDLRAIGYDLAVKPDGEIYIHKADEKLLSTVLSLDEYNIKKGRLGTGDLFLTDKDKKAEFKALFSLTAFDMESAAIACICGKNDIPFLSIRKISDDADDASALDYREMNNRCEDILTRILVAVIEAAEK
ncbi:MAG: 5'-methylthioadenosine/S-adenosylhomocysteine nucleosidase [Acutalibacteraceae bacterium]